MSTCDDIRDALVLYVEGVLSEGEAARIREHLQRCPGCFREIRAVGGVIDSLADPGLFQPEEDLAWQLLPARLAARAGAGPAAARWLPLHFSPRAWGLTMAALLVIVCGSIRLVERHAIQPPPATADASGNQAFLARIQSLQARGSVAEYLAQCRDLLLDLLRAKETCADGGLELSLEVDRARRLLERRRLLVSGLAGPEAVQVGAVCDEIENFLVALSTSEACLRPEDIRRLESHIEKEQLLLRIRLLQAELSME